MNILYVVVENTGHHIPYLLSLLNENNNNVCIVPEKDQRINAKQYVIKYELKYGNYDIVSHLQYIKKIAQIANSEQIDIIHFTFADILYKSFSLGLGYLKKYKIIASFHRMESTKAKNLSRSLIAKKVDAITTHVLGSEHLLKKDYQDRCYFVAYPSVLEQYNFTTEEARRKLKIKTNNPIISVVGVLSEYKGMDILFEALSQIKLPYFLLISGKPSYFTKDYIEGETKKLGCENLLLLRFIEDEEFVASIAAADIVAVPYLKSFEGTSGPMTEGVRLKKTIVGCNHSNIGKYISDYKIGYSCEGGNSDSLKVAIEKALDHPIQYNESMNELVRMQTVQGFRETFQNIYFTIMKKGENK